MLPDVSLIGLLVVAAIAFSAPLLLGLSPRLWLPATIVEILLGIIIGPSVLNWVAVDTPIQVLALIGTVFTLSLGGLEIEYERLRGRLLSIATLSFAVSFGLALFVGFGLRASGLVQSPLFVAILLSATSLAVLIPLLKDAGQISTAFGQLVVAAATIADFATVILLSLFFSREATSAGTQVVLLGSLALLGAAVYVAIQRAERSMRLSDVLLRLQDTSAQIRVRGAMLLLLLFVVFAEHLGIEAILGAFIAGAISKLVDRDQMMTHPDFRHKLEAMAFGFFIPCFFVASGLRFNLGALVADRSSIALVPIFFVALLAVRGLPVLLYRHMLGSAQVKAAGLLQATTLSFPVIGSQIGIELETISAGTGAALVAAALLTVLVFPLWAITILRREERIPVRDFDVSRRLKPAADMNQTR